MEYMTLIGAEDVRSGGAQMKVAASEMQSAANMISTEFDRMRVFLDDWLYRFEEILKANHGINEDG